MELTFQISLTPYNQYNLFPSSSLIVQFLPLLHLSQLPIQHQHARISFPAQSLPISTTSQEPVSSSKIILISEVATASSSSASWRFSD